MMSWRSSRGSISVMERASIDFPVPGSPINITCRFCSEALRITSTACSCPMTWSTSRSGILTSAVDRKSTLLIHESTGGSSSGSPAVSTIFRPSPRKGRFEYTPLLLKHCALGYSNESTGSRLRGRTFSHRLEMFPEKIHAILRTHNRSGDDEDPRAGSLDDGAESETVYDECDAIIFASFANASSTFCPVFAELN